MVYAVYTIRNRTAAGSPSDSAYERVNDGFRFSDDRDVSETERDHVYLSSLAPGNRLLAHLRRSDAQNVEVRTHIYVLYKTRRTNDNDENNNDNNDNNNITSTIAAAAVASPRDGINRPQLV